VFDDGVVPRPFDVDDYPVPDWIQPGVQAQLSGHDTSPHLNGQSVTISSIVPQPPEGRIRVELSTGDEEAVMPDNLKPVGASSVEDPVAPTPYPDEFDPVPDWIQPGVEAQLTGLENTPHMNGKVVKISSNTPQPPEGKIRVVLSTGKEASVKPNNLKPSPVVAPPPETFVEPPVEAGAFPVDVKWEYELRDHAPGPDVPAYTEDQLSSMSPEERTAVAISASEAVASSPKKRRR
jgi:hypothetical protein